jgi:hypothetical protein
VREQFLRSALGLDRARARGAALDVGEATWAGALHSS